MTVLHPLIFGMSWMDPQWLLHQFGTEFFWVCLVIVFVECGLFFPFLPGDTLLFSVGLFIASKDYHLGVDLGVALTGFAIAAFLGNVSGYEIGRLLGPPLSEHDGRILRKRYFDETKDFFDHHGNAALVIGRFVPFVRTYVTVVAGIALLERRRFYLWSAVGAVAWVLIITLLGYFLGSAFPGLGANIDKIVIVLAVFTVVPFAWEWWRRRRKNGETPDDSSSRAEATSDTPSA